MSGEAAAVNCTMISLHHRTVNDTNVNLNPLAIAPNATMESPPGSPLSSHASSEFADDVKIEEREQSLDALPDHDDTRLMPPSKRQRTGQNSYRSTPASHPEPPEDLGDISSDTSGDVPGSPPAPGMPLAQDDDPASFEQVTVCRWLNCPAGDLGNMDVLVQHLHDDHIGIRQKRYACEWEGCPRIGINPASGYALRAHMRSHTREKPFYCALPGNSVHMFWLVDSLLSFLQNVIDLSPVQTLWQNTCGRYTRQNHYGPRTPSQETKPHPTQNPSD